MRTRADEALSFAFKGVPSTWTDVTLQKLSSAPAVKQSTQKL